MYATRLQLDVLFPLKEITGNDNMRMTEARNIKDEKVLKEFFKRIIQYSIQGCLGYNSYPNSKNKEGHHYNPLGFVWTWFHDIFDSKNKKAAFWFKSTLDQYWVINKWAKDLSPLNKSGNDICFVTDIDELQKYSKFDMEEMYQKGVVNEGNFANKFSSFSKYYLINDGVCIKEYTYQELYEFLKNKFDTCVSPDNGYLFIDYFDRNDMSRSIHGRIVRDIYFDNIKSVNEHLVKQDWKNLEPWQVEQLAHKFGYENIAKYGKPYLDKGYAGRIDVCLLVEVINRGDYSNKELEKWIGAFFKEYNTGRDVLETCIKEKIKSEHKPIVRRVYMRFFKKYMEE